jgi:hypothetical protein
MSNKRFCGIVSTHKQWLLRLRVDALILHGTMTKSRCDILQYTQHTSSVSFYYWWEGQKVSIGVRNSEIVLRGE